LVRDGIFYAVLKIRGEEVPLLVALHGVSSEFEARSAFQTLAGLPESDCGCKVEMSI
jgi:hypothetical protein